MTARNSRLVRVDDVTPVAARVKRLRFSDVDGGALPIFSAGAHVIVTMRHGDRVYRNAYSLMSSPLDQSHYAISVLHVPESRGGSSFVHERIAKGATLEIGDPVNLFPIAHTARKHILIAGGIGITPFMAMLAQFRHDKANYELHYAVRSAEEGAYFGAFEQEGAPGVHLYRSDRGHRIPLHEILENQRLGTHIYVCGPQRMIDWTTQSARAAGWPDENVHYEHFDAPPAGNPFVVKLAKSGREIRVGEHQSILEALEQAGVDAPYLCRGGACGQCITRVLGVEGSLRHNDHYLTEDERACGNQIATCVSRIEGTSLTLDL
ncbi:ferredoxin--NADP(+) reductase [Hyphomicrobium methylovorum]|uniref:PDR/VanB family oxidoreductase n=1 Tax=Hyphomicrobium methylovorum TaxID=84 RepID=UPI0015E6D75E|nr:PDR/VanB family oxidoreductase [Hyphomicrobium methylovorum]MBA2127208.1 ferredoxin--NADP(+) reductase [Hyphomicrobium methylovorum]